MEKQLKSGDRVTLSSRGETANCKLVGKLTHRTMIKGHKVAASKDNPEYLVETGEGKTRCAQGICLVEELTFRFPT